MAKNLRVIYEPSGAAGEYARLALNLYTCCTHACRYCYVPDVIRKGRDQFFQKGELRKDIFKKLRMDCQDLVGDPREILLSFTTDPYFDADAAESTRMALKIIEEHELKATVLSKAGPLATQDFDILQRNNWRFGQTIICVKDKTRRQWEPFASTLRTRFEAFQMAKRRGIETWLSLEPVVDPVEALELMRRLCKEDLVDHYALGKMNHNQRLEDSIVWGDYLKAAEQILSDHGQAWGVKADLEAFRVSPAPTIA